MNAFPTGQVVIWSAILVWTLFWSLGGSLIGASRGRRGFGFVMGLLLGFIGWIIILIMPRTGPKCPDCLSVVPAGAIRCRYCGVELPNVPTVSKPSRRRLV